MMDDAQEPVCDPVDEVLSTIRNEIEVLYRRGIVEVAARNPSVMEYMQHWEARAMKSEAEVEALKADNDRLREALRSISTAKLEPGTWRDVSERQKGTARAALKECAE
jgi:chromosome segregation ATPase